ncbi:hypothetical protein Trydic_g16900 [Trypoxylus dichotomus]
MFKAIVFAALLAFAVAAPAAEPEPKAKPGIIAAAYTAPLVASAPLAYSAYSAPLVSSPIVSTYHGVAPALTYSAPLIL